MAGAEFDLARDFTPSPNDGVVERQYTAFETRLQRVARADIAWPLGMVGRYGVYTLVVFTQRQDTEEQRVFRLFRCPSLHARRPIGVYEGSNHIGVEKPSDHKEIGRAHV